MKSFLYLLLLLPLPLLAQNWEYAAPVRPHSKGGYQDIFLPPTVTCHLAEGRGNMRLLDSAGNEVPYLYTEEKPVEEEASIVWLPRYEDDYWARWYSRSFFQNPKALALDRIALKIRNADVHQDFWLSGSDDMNRWYIIKENYAYQSNYDPNSTWNLLTIHFPPVDYKYFKIEIRHFWREPIQILGAGYYAFAERRGGTQLIPDPAITQREEGKQSIIDLDFDAPHYFDQVYFEVDGPELYLRNARLERKNPGGGFDLVKSLQLSSKATNQLMLDNQRGRHWRLVIDNKDDKPIRIAGVQATQRRAYLTAKLNATESYSLKIGEEGLRAPEYDLAYFKNDLPKSRLQASLTAVTDLRRPAPATQPSPDAAPGPASPTASVSAPEKPLWQRPAILWIGIGCIVLLVGGMSIKLLKEMKGNDQ